LHCKDGDTLLYRIVTNRIKSTYYASGKTAKGLRYSNTAVIHHIHDKKLEIHQEKPFMSRKIAR